MEQPIVGLSEAEAAARRQRGQGNNVHFDATRTYLQIVRKNVFTFINTVLFGISMVLVLMGQYSDALVTAGLVLLNVVVGVYQEARAKRRLEHIALLTRPKATVIRDGQEKTLDPGELVLGDVLLARPGDQIVVDGRVLGKRQEQGPDSPPDAASSPRADHLPSGASSALSEQVQVAAPSPAASTMEVDESLLTGESEHIAKQPGDPVYSGSFCVSGSAHYEATQVGAESLANKLTAGARVFRQTKTPLQRDIDYIIRVLVLLVAQLGVLLAISFAMRNAPLLEWMRVAAVIVALVPQGLFFMTTIAYAMGAVRVATSGALIQESNAVESMSNVNLLCLDKTGTLTTNSIVFHGLHLLEEGQARGDNVVSALLGDYAATNAGGTRTSEAIQVAFGGRARPVQDQAPFNSERKWSALVFADAQPAEVLALGAPEVLQPHLDAGASLGPQVEAWTSEGLRVLLFAVGDASTGMRSPEGKLRMPQALKPLALLSFRDELRSEAESTLRRFSELGIGLKIISGDNPQTVAALAKQVGMSGELRTVSGIDLREMDRDQAQKAAQEAIIFGRITPQQKEELVRTFRQDGRYVAMIGDGVNDVLSLKQAQVGIAMQSGSAAARSVADVILLGDSFAALPVAFREGQRIVKGMEDVARLLLTRTLYVLLLVIATRIVDVPFPVTPKHNSILALLTVGIPILAIAAWARPGAPPRSVMRSTSHFIVPAAFTISVVSLAVYLAYLGMSGDVQMARTALTTATVLCGLLLIPFVEPPTRSWEGGDVLSGDWRPTILALAMLLIYGAVLAVPGLRSFFELSPLRNMDYLIIAAGVAIWALLLRLIWRTRLFERVFYRS